MQDIELPEHKQRICQQAQRLVALPGWLPDESQSVRINEALEMVAETWLLMGPQFDSLPNAK